MRARTIISRAATLVLGTFVCLLFVVLAPLIIARHGADEPVTGYSLMASPRDLHVVTSPIRLCTAPDLVLSRGSLYADGNAAAGTPISRFVLDGPVFHLNMSGLQPESFGSASHHFDADLAYVAPLVEQLIGKTFDTLTVQRGMLHLTTTSGTFETLSDINAEFSGWRKDQVTAKGSFTVRGRRVAFDASAAPFSERTPRRLPLKIALKNDVLEAAFDGDLHVANDLVLSGQAELATADLRRVVRWFGVPIPNARGLNAASLKGQLSWARGTLAMEKAKITLDGNEASGALALGVAGTRPLVDATLAFGALDITPYVDGARSQSFVFDRQTNSWSIFDLSFPLIKHMDADLRVSSPKVSVKGYALGRGAATITMRSGKLQADIAEIELPVGPASAQLTVDMNPLVPHYSLRGKMENLDANAAGTLLFGTPVLSGRPSLIVEVAGTGQTPAQVLRSLSGKATLGLADGGRLPLDLKALRNAGRAENGTGWGVLGKGQTSLEQVEARMLLRDGVLIADSVHARSGGAGIAATGRVDLLERTFDLRLAIKNNAPADRPLKGSDMLGADAVTVRGPWADPFVRPDTAEAPN